MLNIHKRLPLALALVAGLLGAQLPAEAATYSYRQPAIGLVVSAGAAAPAPAPVSCTLPWGGSLASGGSVSAYPLATVAAPGSCVAEMLTCANGVLSNPTAVQSCTVTDPDWAGVSAQLEFDGDVVDARGATVTKVGVATPATSSSVFKVGTGALDLSTGGYVTLPSASLNFGTQDFTVEFWYQRKTDNGSYQHLLMNQAGDGSSFIINFGNSGFGNKLMVYTGSNASPLTIAEVTKATVGTAWHHYAVTRYQGTLNVYLDGFRVAQRANQTANLTHTSPWVIGSASGYNALGYFDSVRITKGVARYTGASFTPNTMPFAVQ